MAEPGFFVPGPWAWVDAELVPPVEEQARWALDALGLAEPSAETLASRISALWSTAAGLGASRLGVAVEPLAGFDKVVAILEFRTTTDGDPAEDAALQDYATTNGRPPGPEDELECDGGLLLRHEFEDTELRQCDYWVAEPGDEGYLVASFVETRLELPLRAGSFDAIASTLYWDEGLGGEDPGREAPA
jgi:hypothetical protein